MKPLTNKPPVSVTETFAWCLLGMSLLTVRLLFLGGPAISNDSYQYLSVAKNFLDGYVGYTSIVHFDTERTWGTVPAPITTFPFGYPMLTAAISALGLSVENAALLISMACLPVLLFLYRWAATSLCLKKFAVRVMYVLTLGNSWLLYFSTSITTEALFTVMSFAAVATLLANHRHSEQFGIEGIKFLLIGNILLGLCYWVRYAGLFFFAGVVLYYLAVFLRSRNYKPLALTLVSFAIIGVGMARNYLSVGTWKGGNDKEVLNPFVDVIHTYTLSFLKLLVGGLAPFHFGTQEVLLLIGLVTILVMARIAFKRRRENAQRTAMMIATLVVVYLAALAYAGSTTVISLSSRLFFPLIPLLVLLIGIYFDRMLGAFQQNAQRVFSLSVAICLVAYTGINSRSWTVEAKVPKHRLVEQRLSSERSLEDSLYHWLEANVPRDAVIVATDGQATGYALSRRTVSLVSSEFSNTAWTETDVLSLMETYGARHLIVYRNSDPEVTESRFLQRLLARRLPDWLVCVKDNGRAAIFEKRHRGVLVQHQGLGGH